MAMTLLTHRGGGPAFPCAGQPVHILAGHGGQPPGSAAMEITVPGHFAGPVPHAHDEFDEAIYVRFTPGTPAACCPDTTATPLRISQRPRGNATYAAVECVCDGREFLQSCWHR
jgi:hypothetical protein